MIESLLPTDRPSMHSFATARRAHRDHPVAQRLYSRMRRRSVVLLHPVPIGIKRLIAEWLHRDQLVLGATLHVDATGRRFACLAGAWEPHWWHTAAVDVLFPALPNTRVVQHLVLWPAPAGSAGLYADLPF